jgi:hypothetical protein
VLVENRHNHYLQTLPGVYRRVPLREDQVIEMMSTIHSGCDLHFASSTAAGSK